MSENESIKDVYEWFDTPFRHEFSFVWILPVVFVGSYFFISVYTGLSKYAPMPVPEKVFDASLLTLSVFLFFLRKLYYYKKLLRQMEREWPTKEKQELLNQDFLEAESILSGKVRIGINYIYFQEQFFIDPINNISFFTFSDTSTNNYTITARSDKYEIDTLRFGKNKKGEAEASEKLVEANRVLSKKKEENKRMAEEGDVTR